MSFPRYPKYKASGVEWLGEVPEHWSTGRLRHFTRRYSGGTPDKTNLGYWQNGVIPWLNSGSVNDRLISEPSTLITAEAFANSSAKWIPAGALVMALAGQGKTKGMVAQLAIPSTCNQSMAAIVTKPTVNARFLFWWLDSNYQSIRNLAGGDLRDGLNLELVGDIPLPVVPLPEQKAIAEFLDRETGKIDGLVAEQKSLMELLKEKRQAVISHAVTKGLNPHAPMKPSGIDWLGDVPDGWEVWKFAHFAPILTCGVAATPEYVEDGIPFLSAQNVKGNKVLFENHKYISEETHKELTRHRTPIRGDVLLSRVGTIGEAAVVESDKPFSIFVSLTHIRCEMRVCLNHYVVAIFESAYFRTYSKVVTVYGGGVGNLNVRDLCQFKIPLPPINEQRLILDFIWSETTKLDTLKTEAQRAIDLLQERRTALISAAVTGQIDVRKEVT